MNVHCTATFMTLAQLAPHQSHCPSDLLRLGRANSPRPYHHGITPYLIAGGRPSACAREGGEGVIPATPPLVLRGGGGGGVAATLSMHAGIRHFRHQIPIAMTGARLVGGVEWGGAGGVLDTDRLSDCEYPHSLSQPIYSSASNAKC